MRYTRPSTYIASLRRYKQWVEKAIFPPAVFAKKGEVLMALLSLSYLSFFGECRVFSQKSMLRTLIRGDSFEVPEDLRGQVYRLWKMHGKMLIHIFQGKQRELFENQGFRYGRITEHQCL